MFRIRRKPEDGPQPHNRSFVHKIWLEYPPNPVPRYGYGKPPHPAIHRLIEEGRGRYQDTLAGFLGLRQSLLAVPRENDPKRPAEPAWINEWLSGLDAVALYCLVARQNPRVYLEIGSGHSTRFARRAIRDHGLATRVISIDPQPRAEIDAICDEVIRERLEAAPLTAFEALQSGDIVFLDSSHRIFTNSDVAVFFLEIIPRLQPGVLVHVHDIYWPSDYPPEWSTRYYSEQYLLGAHLLARDPGLQIVLPNAFISTDPELSRILEPLWQEEAMQGVQPNGCSFWFRVT